MWQGCARAATRLALRLRSCCHAVCAPGIRCREQLRKCRVPLTRRLFPLARCVFLGTVVLFAFFGDRHWSFGPDAKAGALPQEVGKGIEIATVFFMRGRAQFNSKGNLGPTARYTKEELMVWREHGLLPWLTFVGTADAGNVRVGAPNAEAAHGPGLAGNGLRALLYSQDGFALSAQLLEQVQTGKNRLYPALVGLAPSVTDMRLMAGYYQGEAALPYFLEGEGAFLARTGGVANEWHVDVTLGFRPRSDGLVLIQSFNLWSTRRTFHQFGNVAQAYQNSKLQASYVHDVTDSWSFQIGVYGSVLGTNSLKERGVITALWHRF